MHDVHARALQRVVELAAVAVDDGLEAPRGAVVVDDEIHALAPHRESAGTLHLRRGRPQPA